MSTIRKELIDVIITQLSAFRDGNNAPIFAQVKKFYTDQPEIVPAALVYPDITNVNVDGVDYDSKVLGYKISAYELMEGVLTDEERAAKIDRIMDIEDIIANWVETIPNPVEHFSNDYHVYKAEFTNASYEYVPGDRGVALYLEIDLRFYVNINVKDL